MFSFILQASPQLVNPAHPAADEFVKMDPFGVGLAVIAMLIVFSVLIFIFLLLKYISRFYLAQSAKRAAKYEIKNSKPVKIEDINPEMGAAIAMAIHLYFNQQNEMESLKLTIQKVSRLYSPWSSKIYTLRHTPR